MVKWETVPLGEVISQRKGSISIDEETNYKLCRVQLHRRGVLLREEIKGSLIKTKKQQVCKNGDFIVAEMDAKVGGYGFIPEALNGAIVSSHYYLYELNKSKIIQDYFEVLIKTDIIQDQIAAKGSTNYASVRAWEVLDYKIPLPPIENQIEIAQIYNKYSQFNDQFTNEYNRQLTILKLVRQAILLEAVEGRLTAEWRKSNPDLVSGDNHAKHLFEKIKAEKEQLVREGKIKKQKPLPPIADEEKLFDLPDGWVWCRLEDIGYLMGGGTPSTNNPEYWNGSVSWVCPKDMKTETIIDSIDTITELGLKESSAKLIPRGSVLFVVRGMILAHTFPVGINIKPVAINQDMKALLPYVLSTNLFIMKMLKGYSQFILRLTNTSTHGTKRLEYSESYSKLAFPLPPLLEQRAIVELVDRLNALVDGLEKQVAERKEKAKQLMQTVLREAFEE